MMVAMKIIILILQFLLIPVLTVAQTVFPIGAKWHYSESFAFSGDQRYMTMTSVGDTIINDLPCRILEKSKIQGCSNRPDKEYFHINDAGEVFFFDSTLTIFQKLYDFNAKAGEKWTILLTVGTEVVDSVTYSVDSISLLTINDLSLKVFHTSIYTHQRIYESHSHSKYIEKIGDIGYFFPWKLRYCDDNFFYGLRCYEDNEVGFYSTGIVDSCNYVFDWVSINITRDDQRISIFPNPVSDILNIRVDNSQFFKYKVFNTEGQIILVGEASKNTLQIDFLSFTLGYILLNSR